MGIELDIIEEIFVDEDLKMERLMWRQPPRLSGQSEARPPYPELHHEMSKQKMGHGCFSVPFLGDRRMFLENQLEKFRLDRCPNPHQQSPEPESLRRATGECSRAERGLPEYGFPEP